jgi:hypothetical protein
MSDNDNIVGMPNTTPEMYDDNVEQSGATPEQLLMNENDILSGLLRASKGKDDTDNYRKIQIKRNGELLFEFRIRPLSEDENQSCWRRATKYAPTKPGQPRVAVDTDISKYRSSIIYAATVNEDRAKVWDNKRAQDSLGVLQGVDMVDKVLLAGEKSRVFDLIDEISASEDDTEELVKN